MGTSASSSGPGSGVSFDPPWLDDIEIPSLDKQDDAESDELDSDNDNSRPESADALKIEPLAPSRRFQPSRTQLGHYLKTGDKSYLKSSLGSYSKTGMGGARRVASRMRLSGAVASNLYSALSSSSSKSVSFKELMDQLQKEGASARKTIDAVIILICPNGGSLDEVSTRESISNSLSDLYERNPDANISNLHEDEIWSLISSFLSYEAFNRVQLDIGQNIESVELPYPERITRLNDMREYLEAAIATQIDKIRRENTERSTSALRKMMEKAIEETFRVFEVES